MQTEDIKNTQRFPGVVARAEESSKDDTNNIADASTESFDDLMGRILTPNGQNQVSEEALFAAVIQERVTTLKGSEAGTKFEEQFAKDKQSNTRPDGVIAMEEAARDSLQALVDDGTLTEEEATKIHGQAFKSSQLDDNLEVLYDDRGGAGDPTMAVATMEAALLSARTMIEKIDSGEETAGELTLDLGNTGLPNIKVITSTDGTFSTLDSGPTEAGNPLDGAEGFLFKPESDSDGKLVVLLPHSFKEQVEAVILRDSEQNEIDRGRQSGYANGDREHFRFSRPGGDYGKNITVEVQFSDGSIKQYSIPNPSERYD